MTPPASYASTIRHLAVGPSTRCLVQGLGKSSVLHTRLSMDLGTCFVGGVRPSKPGSSSSSKPASPAPDLPFPTFPSVRTAMSSLTLAGERPDATAVFVPALAAADAILEAIEAEVPLIVAVAEGIPLRDQMRVQAALQSQSRSRLVGGNSPGLCVPAGCRLGISPLMVARPGPVAIASRSGTLSYEASSSIAHVGQSYILGLGGDFYPGTRIVEALRFFLGDYEGGAGLAALAERLASRASPPEAEVTPTRGIILVGEPGGSMEEEVTAYLSSLLSSPPFPGFDPQRHLPPIVGFLAGQTTPPAQIFGHSGAVWRDGVGSAKSKRRGWQSVGIEVVDTIAETGPAIERLMRARGLL